MAEERQIYVLYTKISKDLSEDLYKRCLIFLTDFLREKHFRYRRWQDRAANLLSMILLIKGLQKFGYDYTLLENLKFTPHKRPYLLKTIDFNISHSGEYVICAIGNEIRVGVDIERIDPVDFSDFESLMTTEQWVLIRNANNPQKKFFTYWAIKESIIKADGRGLVIPLNEIMIMGEVAYYEHKWYLKELHLDENYCASLASDQENALINLEFIHLDTI